MRNKIYALFVIVTFMDSESLYSQMSPEMGIKAGISVPNLTSGNALNPVSSGYGSRLDADGAVYVEFHIDGHFSFQPQLEYCSQGGKKNGTQAFATPMEMSPLFPPAQAPEYLYADYKSEARMNYLMLPLLAKYHFCGDKRWDPYVAAGPFISLLISAENITKGSSIIFLDKGKTQPLTSTAQSFDSKDNIINDLHRFNYGIAGHLGLSRHLKIGKVFIEAGGNYGLVNIQKNNANGKNKTGAAVISMGYQFGL